ncbi:EpsG family protein [Citrobacter braakii]|uniref:EpsG family protein n=1 Tax=Citrobacter braakii TaxID=57706 RepID=UPI002282218F|nr:EpsG family protein [Citrobacter braakii]MCY9797021.1 EpsG family protein [Citrobacter braakii]MDL4385185.1 EpsG family protein [Citrobacter braakii]
MVYTYFIFNAILFFAVFFSFLYENVKAYGIRIILILSVFFIIWIPASIRYGVGTDYFSYLGIFENVKLGAITTEFGYYLINFFVYKTGLNEQFIFAISSFIVCFNFFRSLDRSYIWLTVLVFLCTFYLPSLSLVRQAIAVSFAGLAVYSILNSKEYKFLIFILIGCFFHYSIIILIPFYFVRNIKLSPKFLLAVTIFGCIILMSSNFLINIMDSSLLGNTKYGYYATSKFNTEAEIGSGLGVVMKLLLPAFAIISAKNLVKLNPKTNIVLMLSVAAIVANVASMKIHIFNRVADIFIFLPYILTPLLIRQFSLRANRVILSVLLSLLFLVFFERTIYTNLTKNNSGLGINPYVTIFNR